VQVPDASAGPWCSGCMERRVAMVVDGLVLWGSAPSVADQSVGDTSPTCGGGGRVESAGSGWVGSGGGEEAEASGW
jgi:hypothetical protein